MCACWSSHCRGFTGLQRCCFPPSPSAQPVVVPMQVSAWLYCDQGTKNLAPRIKGWERYFDERASFRWRTLEWVGGQQGWEAVTHRYSEHGAVKVCAKLCRRWLSEVTARSIFHGMILSNPACAPNLCSPSDAPLKSVCFFSLNISSKTLSTKLRLSHQL